MKSFLDKFFLRTNNLGKISQSIVNLSNNTPANKIFKAINSYSLDSQIRYVGGCIRKIISDQKVDDIDLATNLKPDEVCDALKKNDLSYYETGLEYETITAVIDNYKFEITSLREDISTDGRHAKVKFSSDWKKDASRRDFTINSIYADEEGNLFDPYEGKKDLEKGLIKFIGNPNDRIKEDYLRILRYLRFFLNYSKKPHSPEIIKTLKVNIDGVSRISKERMLDELKKIISLKSLEKLSKDQLSLSLISNIFPELKNIRIFFKLTSEKKIILKEKDFMFFLSLMIIDETDNTDYFLYKYNISKKDQKRLKIIDDFYKDKINKNSFLENNLNRIFYYFGNQAVDDILAFGIIKYKKFDENLIKLRNFFKDKIVPVMPINATELMNKYNILQGKQLGVKLKLIEKKWVDNNFKISDEQINYIVNN